jgi:hypothetical protein
MKKTFLIFLFILSAFGIGLIELLNPFPKDAIAAEIVVYQSRTCGCCKKWVNHLKESGFKVNSEFLDDVADVKLKMKVPMKLASCHTAVANGYIIEGHVPATAVKELLTKRPAIRGISVPGMPMGSPGMEGSYKESFDVVSFDKNNQVSKFMGF